MKLGYVIDRTRDDLQVIVEVPTKNQFFPSYPNTKKYAEFTETTVEEMYSALFRLGIRLIPEKYEERLIDICKAFKNEVCKNSLIYYNEKSGYPFYTKTIKT